MELIAIIVVGTNRVIGNGHSQPFKIAEDWARFKRVTMGHPMILGRRTHDAIGRWLPGRATIVVTRNPDAVPVPNFPPATAGQPATSGFVVSTLDEALELAATLDEVVFVGGGGTIYEQSWDRLTELDITEVVAAGEGDVLLPVIDPQVWQEVSRDPREGYAFVRYRRR